MGATTTLFPILMKKLPHAITAMFGLGASMLLGVAPLHADNVQMSPRLSHGETVRCVFKRHGIVVINTRPNQETITVRGKVLPAQSGSYFYQTRSGDIALMHTPNMKRWTYGSEQGREETTSNCTKRKNRPTR